MSNLSQNDYQYLLRLAREQNERAQSEIAQLREDNLLLKENNAKLSHLLTLRDTERRSMPKDGETYTEGKTIAPTRL